MRRQCQVNTLKIKVNRRFKAVQDWNRSKGRGIELINKGIWRNREEKVFNRRNWLIHKVNVIQCYCWWRPCLIKIKRNIIELVFSYYYTSHLSEDVVVNSIASTNCEQTVKQLEVIQEIVLSEVLPKLNVLFVKIKRAG